MGWRLEINDANPRIEQNIIVKSEQLYMFHKQWMDEFFSRSG